MTITLKDIAKETGVDSATVSRALNGVYGVHKDTREKVLAVAKRLNYRVNQMAKGLAIGKSHTLGLLVPDIRNPFVTELVRGAEDAAFAAGYHILLCNSYLDASREVQYVHSLLDKRVEGILMHSVHGLSKGEIKELIASGVPVVLLHQQSSASAFSSVCVNQFEGGILAGKHLIELGHKGIAYLSGPRGHSNFSERAKGFMKAMMSSKQKITPVIMHGTPDFEGGYQMAKEAAGAEPGDHRDIRRQRRHCIRRGPRRF